MIWSYICFRQMFSSFIWKIFPCSFVLPMFCHLRKSVDNDVTECVRLTKWYHFIFIRLSKVWSMLHYGSVKWVQTKYSTLCFHLLFWHDFVVFHHKFCVFIILISFYDNVSNFRNRILTNQKHKLVVSNCQWNCR